MIAGLCPLLAGGVRAETATPVPGLDGAVLLNDAAANMLDLTSFRFKIVYEEGQTTIYDTIKVSKIEGSVVRPDQISAKAEAKLGFVGIDVNATILAGKVSVDAIGVGGDVGIDDDVAVLLIDPTTLIVDAAAAVDNPVVTGYEQREGGQVIWISGTFNPEQLSGSSLEPFLSGLGPRAVEIAIDEQGLIASIRLDGPVISYDSDNVIRRIDFYDFNAVPGTS